MRWTKQSKKGAFPRYKPDACFCVGKWQSITDIILLYNLTTRLLENPQWHCRSCTKSGFSCFRTVRGTRKTKNSRPAIFLSPWICSMVQVFLFTVEDAVCGKDHKMKSRKPELIHVIWNMSWQPLYLLVDVTCCKLRAKSSLKSCATWMRAVWWPSWTYSGRQYNLSTISNVMPLDQGSKSLAMIERSSWISSGLVLLYSRACSYLAKGNFSAAVLCCDSNSVSLGRSNLPNPCRCGWLTVWLTSCNERAARSSCAVPV